MASKDLVPTLNDAQLTIINGATPKKYIKQRVGRGNKTFDYIEVGYVVQTLNQAFHRAWDWEVDQQEVGRTQVWVKGRLTVYFSPEFKVTKTSFGGSDIKKNRDGEVIDIADDLKAASADALKKAASMIGIGADVYFPQMDRLEELQDIHAVDEPPARSIEDFPSTVVNPLTDKDIDEIEKIFEEPSADIDYKNCSYKGCTNKNLPTTVVKFSRDHFGSTLCYTHQPNRNI